MAFGSLVMAFMKWILIPGNAALYYMKTVTATSYLFFDPGRSSRQYEIIKYKNECIIGASLPGHQEILVVSGDAPVARKVLSFPGEPIDLASISTNDDNLIFLKRPNATTNLTYSFHNNHLVAYISSSR